MTQEEQAVLLIKGSIAELPNDEQEKVHECAAKMLKLLIEYGHLGLMALALVGAVKARGDA